MIKPNAKNAPILGEAIPTKKEGVYQVMTPALFNTCYKITCPKCGKIITFMVNKKGRFTITCVKCGSHIIGKSIDRNDEANEDINVYKYEERDEDTIVRDDNKIACSHEEVGEDTIIRESDDTVCGNVTGNKNVAIDGDDTVYSNVSGNKNVAMDGDDTVYGNVIGEGTVIGKGYKPEEDNPCGRYSLNESPKSKGKLVWWSKTGRKSFILREGKNYIGRRNEDMPSDLSLKDEYASSRSICIEVTKDDSRLWEKYSYHLTVERATNPILVCGMTYTIGEGVDLKYGDTIVLGRTKLTLKET